MGNVEILQGLNGGGLGECKLQVSTNEISTLELVPSDPLSGCSVTLWPCGLFLWCRRPIKFRLC